VTDNSDLGRKILVAGQGGKSTLARALAAELSLPYIELGALSHLPNYAEPPVHPSELNGSVSRELGDVALKAISVSIEERFSRPAELLGEALDGLAAYRRS